MTTKNIIVVGAIAFATVLPGSVQAQAGFVRPVVSIDSADTAGFSSTVGFGLACGVWRGAADEHEFSVEWHRTGWDFASLHLNYPATGRETHQPLLLNYRYRFGRPGDRVRFHAGPSLGYTRSKVEMAIAFPTLLPAPPFRRQSAGWKFTWSAVAGFGVRCTERLDLDVSYRYLSFPGEAFAEGAAPAIENNREAHFFSAGLGVRF